MRARALGSALFAAALALLLTAPAEAAGAKREEPESPQPDATSAEQLASSYYERGLDHRDKAWKLEEKAAKGKKADKLLAKAAAHWEKAVVAFQEAVAADPRSHQAYGSLGYAYRNLGRYQESLDAYDRSLELAPTYVEAIEYRGEAYLGLDRLDEAKQAYLELFRLDREQADTLLGAMREWVGARRGGGEVAAAVVEDFASWVDERSEIADQTGKLTEAQGRSW
jgi:tetratricopeptide (TPR) repeat protein